MNQQSKIFNILPLLLLPPLFWAGNFVVGKAIHTYIPPFSLAFLRWVVAFLVILPFAWQFLRRDKALYHQYIGRILATAIMGVTLFNTLIYKGLHYTSTTNALLLNSCIPILIVLFGYLFYQQKMYPKQIIGLIISLIGVLSIVLQGSLKHLLSLSLNVGDIWVFLAMICWAYYTIWTKAFPTNMNKIGLTAIQIFIAIIVLLPFCLWELSSGQNIDFNQKSLFGLAYIGIFPSVMAYLLYAFAVEKVGAMHAGLSIHLMPVFGVALSVAFLNEQFLVHHAIGIGLIAIGLWLCQKSN